MKKEEARAREERRAAQARARREPDREPGRHALEVAGHLRGAAAPPTRSLFLIFAFFSFRGYMFLSSVVLLCVVGAVCLAKR